MAATAPRPGRSADDLSDRRVLVVEDDAPVREVVVSYLRAAGFLVDEAADGLEALRLLRLSVPDLVILDRLLPGLDGVEIARRIQRIAPVPIVMLTALGTTEHRIEGLEAGVDDYVTKPFSVRELVLRVQSVLRRSLAEFAPEAPFDLGRFRLDPNQRRVWLHGELLGLATREYELLAFLLKHPNQAFTREQLLRAVWHWDFGDLSTVTVHVRRLREKIEQDVARPRLLTTVWGVGYQLSVAEEP